MTYDIQIDSQRFTVEIERDGAGWRLRVDGDPVEVDSTVVDEGTLSLLLGDEACTFQMDRKTGDNGGSHWLVGYRGRQFAAEVRDRRRLRRGGHGVEQEGRARLSAPMAGKVARVLVQAGEAVQAGQAVLVLEAMKMQNEVRSPKSGAVVSLAVAEGSAVTTGQLLAEIE